MEVTDDVDAHSFNLYLGYGLSSKLNLTASLPYIRWETTSRIDGESTTRSGFRDLSLGVQYNLANSTAGPGQKIFATWNMYLPTAESYEFNPFEMEDGMGGMQKSGDLHDEDLEDFALGNGHWSTRLGLEFWHRSAFVIVPGLTTGYQFPLNTSDAGYQSGQVFYANLHGILQKSLFWKIYPYARLKYRHETKASWAGNEAMNSGGSFIDGSVSLNMDISRSQSAVLFFDFPIYHDIDGTQPVSNYLLGLSFRHSFN